MKTQNIETLITVINAKFDTRIEKEISLQKHSTAKKFSDEKRMFATAYAQVMQDHKIDPAFIDNIAIYAMQKIRKVLHAIAHNSASVIDDNTKAIFANAKRNKYKTLSSNQQNMCLSADIKARDNDDKSIVLRDRRVQAASTATTQASSTRAALEALSIASADPRSDALTFNTESAMFQAFEKVNA